MKPPQFADAGFFVFRVPLLPVAAFRQLTLPPAARAQGSDDHSWNDAWCALLDQSPLGNAVALQSPSLWGAIVRSRDAGAEFDKSPEAQPLFRYVSRSALRCTPRGLFAETGIGRIADRTALDLGGAGQASVVVDLSLDYLSALLQLELSRAGSPAEVCLAANPTLALFGDTVSVWESNGAGADSTARQVMLKASELLQRIVASLGSEPLTNELVRDLLTASGVPRREHASRLNELTHAQILVPDLGVSTTAADPVRHFINQLPKSGSLGKVRRALSRVRTQLRCREWTPMDFSLLPLEALQATLPPVTGFEHANRVFQIETFCNSNEVTVSAPVINKLARAIERLHAVFGDLHADRLIPFADAFLERFGEATVPLLRVIDVEHGVGGALTASTPGPQWARRGRRAAMLRLIHKALDQRVQAIELDHTFWSSITDETVPGLPPGFSAVCSVIASSAAAVDAGAYEVLLDCAVGSDGTELWSRHSRLSDPFRSAANDIHRRLRVAATNATVRADVSFTPNRGADVAWRSGAQGLQITCTVTSPIPGVEQLPMADLYVQVRNDKVRLLSRRLAREVVPVVGSAFDPEAANSPLFKFLCSLAQQGYATPLQWDWGELSDSPFLPRIHDGGVTLAPARWRVDRAGIQSLPRGLDDAMAVSTRQRWREVLRIPRWVSIRYGEDRVGCDLAHWTGVEMIHQEVARVGFAVLEELRVEPTELCVTGGAGRFVHELVVPFLHAQEKNASARKAVSVRDAPSTWSRKFSEGVRLPGSEWVYAKLYASPRRIQSMLRGEVPALVERLRTDCRIRECFFFRYKDSDWHLRLRVRAPGKAQRARVLDAINAVAVGLHATEAMWRLQYDTYYREIERFGGARACRLVERVFAVESELAFEVLATWQDDEAYAEHAVPLAAGWVLWTWTRLGLAPREIVELSRQLGLAVGHRRRGATKRGEPAPSPRRHELAEVAERGSPWQIYAQRAAKPLGQIANLAKTGSLGVELNELAGDLSHLMVNRLFHGDHEEREHSVYRSVLRQMHRLRLG